MTPLPLSERIWLAWIAFFKILLDGMFAARVRRLPEPVPESKLPQPPPSTAALQLLALLQREGRFIDFVEQDVTAFSDADVGAAARVVHEGCRKALRSHGAFAPVRSEEEGSSVTLPEGFDSREVKLIGNVRGQAPYLVHRGWRASSLTLPAPMQDHDPSILAPAEVEL
jgi:hypothetical protein